MRTSTLLLLGLTLFSRDLFAQCENCDSLLEAHGYRVITDEEIRYNPGLLIMTTSVDCQRLCEEANRPKKPPVKFQGKWGWLAFRYGVTYDGLKTSGRFVGGFKFDRSRQHYFSLGFDLDAPEWRGFIIRAEVALRQQAFNGTDPETQDKALRRWQINGYTTSEEIVMGYKSRKGVFRWFLFAGMGGYQLRMKHNTQIDYAGDLPRQKENPLEIRAANGYTSLSAGIMYLNRIELRFKRTGTQWSRDTENYKMNNRSNIITVGYRI